VVSGDPGTCSVWWARPGMLRAEHLLLLDPVEQGRRLRCRDEADGERSALAAVVLRLGAASVIGADPAGLEVVRRCGSCDRPHGRPRVVGSQVHVSVSHSADRVAVAVTAVAPIGIDVERVSDVGLDDLVGRVLGPDEVVARPRDFFVYWTRKESVVKATGTGLRVPLRDVLVSSAASPARLVSCPGMPAGAASMLDLDPGCGYVGALTVLAPVLPVVRQMDAGTLLAASA
jgi:4'-phosphopantetheinyl transferase